MEIGNIVNPSIYNTDERIESKKEYVVLDRADGCVKVAYNQNDTDWYSEEDFTVVRKE